MLATQVQETEKHLQDGVDTSIADTSTFSEAEQTTESKVGGTTYIVTSHYKTDTGAPLAGEGLLDKLWRLIENDTEN